MNKKRILGLFGDPGGAGAAAPVLERLQADANIDLQLYAYRQAAECFQKRELSYTPLDETVSDDDINELLTSGAPALLFAGTSSNGVNLERKFTQAARQAGVPSLAVLDFWCNYRMRFADEQGQLQYVPDKIAIMDDRAQKEMIQEGFDPRCLVVTGQPALDDLVEYGQQFTPARRREIRESLKVAENELLVVFASQPLSTLYGGANAPGYPGYDETTVLPLFFSALESIAPVLKRPICVLIRPHPREDASKFEAYRSDHFRTLVGGPEDARDVCLAAELVTGMTSMLILVACYLGCQTLSLQPGLTKADPLPTTQTGETRVVYEASQIETALRELLLLAGPQGNKIAASPIRRDCGAAGRLLRLIHSMAGVL